MKRLLELDISKESKKGTIKFIIFFHDLDGFPSDEDKINDYRDWFHSIRLHNDLDVLFLVIWESEALLLADIEVVNKFYKVKINYGNKNPLFEKEPKEYLQRQTQKKYVQSDCTELFTLMDFDTVYKNHKGEISFQSFIDELDEKLF